MDETTKQSLQTPSIPTRNHPIRGLYYRFNLSHWDIEDMLAERGIIVTRESIRLWCNKFGRYLAINAFFCRSGIFANKGKKFSN